MEFKSEFNQMNDSYQMENDSINGYHMNNKNDLSPKRG